MFEADLDSQEEDDEEELLVQSFVTATFFKSQPHE